MPDDSDPKLDYARPGAQSEARRTWRDVIGCFLWSFALLIFIGALVLSIFYKSITDWAVTWFFKHLGH